MLLSDLFDYNPETGVLTRKPRPREMFASLRAFRVWNARFANKPAGSLTEDGYVRVHHPTRKHLLAHRLIWELVTGEVPVEIDHINHIRSDNRWVNLRHADRNANSTNRPMTIQNKSGVVGVSWDPRKNKWNAKIGLKGQSILLGKFKNFDDAVAARRAAEIQHGFHPNHGRKRRS